MKRRIIKASENVRGARGGLSHTSPRNFNLQEPSSAEYGKFMTESRWKTWNDAYKLFFDAIENCDNATEECIEEAVRKCYEYHKGNPYMEEAYRRWRDGDEPVEAAEQLASKAYPQGYIELQKALQTVRKLIEQNVDDKLEPYANWDDISYSCLFGMAAIADACRAAETSSRKV